MNFAWKVQYNKITFPRLVLNRCNLNWKTLSSFQTVSRVSTGVQNKYVCTFAWEAYRQSSTFRRYMEVDLTHLRLKRVRIKFSRFRLCTTDFWQNFSPKKNFHIIISNKKKKSLVALINIIIKIFNSKA